MAAPYHRLGRQLSRETPRRWSSHAHRIREYEFQPHSPTPDRHRNPAEPALQAIHAARTASSRHTPPSPALDPRTDDPLGHRVSLDLDAKALGRVLKLILLNMAQREQGSGGEYREGSACFKDETRRITRPAWPHDDLRGEVPATVEVVLELKFVHRVGADTSNIVGVFVAAGKAEDALTDQVDHVMADLTGLAIIGQVSGDGPGQSEVLVGGFENRAPPSLVVCAASKTT